MLTLVVDTAGPTGGVLLGRNESPSLDPMDTHVLGEGILPPREFSTQLISTVAQILEANRLTISEVDVFTVISGPGSFTGLRVGLSAVKAMAEVMAKPIIAVSSLAVLASAAAKACPEKSAGVVHSVLDAGRGEFYHGIYRDEGWTCVAESFETRAMLMESLESTAGMAAACEPVVLDALKALHDNRICQVERVSVREALPLVLAAWRERRFCDVAVLDANYLHRMNPGIRLKKAIASESANDRAGKP